MAAKFTETVKENTKASQHWKRERTRIQMEEIPGEEKEELNVVDIEELKRLNQEDLEQGISAMKEGIAANRPDLVWRSFLSF